METVEQTLIRLEQQAQASRSTQTLVSGKLRLDVVFVPDLRRFSWRLDGRIVDRERAAEALERTRAAYQQRALHGLSGQSSGA